MNALLKMSREQCHVKYLFQVLDGRSFIWGTGTFEKGNEFRIAETKKGLRLGNSL